MESDPPLQDFRPFEPVDHTADLAFIARGRTLCELFENAASGLTAFLLEPGVVAEAFEDIIEVEGADAEELLAAWLQEILFRIQTRGRIYSRFRVTSVTPPTASGSCSGEPLNPDRHAFQAEIKAVTYHGLQIVEEDAAHGRLLRVQIVLDM